MNERLQELLDAVQRTASQVGGSAADAAYGMGKRAGELLSVAKLNIRIMDLKGAVSTALREVGEMIYATHTGTLTESEVLLAKLQEIDGLRQQIDRLEREIARLQGGAVCPFCGAMVVEAQDRRDGPLARRDRHLARRRFARWLYLMIELSSR